MRMIRLPEEALQGPRLRLRPLEQEDCDRMRLWKENVSPLLLGYNYGTLTQKEREFWYRSKREAGSRYLAMDIEDHPFIGFLGIKHLQLLRRRAEFGIVLDPAFQSRGYGREGMELFLDHCFRVWELREIYLRCNRFNHQAQALYQKLGFQRQGEGEEPFENQDLAKDPALYAGEEDAFFLHHGIVYAKLWKMTLHQEDFASSLRREHSHGHGAGI